MENNKTAIIVDSCCDTKGLQKELINFISVPFKIIIGDKTYVDDKNLNKQEMIDDMYSSSTGAKSSCPSPQDYLDAFNKVKDAANIFVVTLSSKLSGTYDSAMNAKNMFLEEFKGKFVHIFDSKSAAGGETNVALKIQEYINEQKENNEIVKKVEDYIDNMKTYFVLDRYDNLIKNGRMSKFKSFLVKALNINPIMKANDGIIGLSEKVRGKKQVYKRLVDLIGETMQSTEGKTITITHCNVKDLAEDIKKMIQEKYNFKNIHILDSGGLTTMYEELGGIVLAF